MAKQLLFDPAKVKSLKVPFMFFTTVKAGEHRIEYQAYNTWNIEKFFIGHDSQAIAIFALLTSEKLTKQKNKFEYSHRKLKLKKNRHDYIDKHLEEYYHNSLRKVFGHFDKQQSFYHRIQVGPKRFQNLPCSFDAAQNPELSFKLEKKGKKLYINALFRLDGKVYPETQVKRFRFLICLNNTYYLLKKSDFNTIKSVASAGWLSYQDYIEKYHKKLDKYPLDLNGIFELETRKVKPENSIQVSELGGNMLLFLPRWDYDGVLVEGNEDDFKVYEGQKQITYLRDKQEEQKTLEFLQSAHPNFKGKTNFFLTFKQASKKNWFFNFYHDQLKDNFTITGMDMLGYFRYSDSQVHSKLSITKTLDNLITAKFTTHFGNEKIDTKSLQKALAQDDRFVLLKDNSLGVLTEGWFEEYAAIVKSANIDGDEIEFAKWLLLISKPTGNQKALEMILPENWLAKWESWNQSEDRLYEKPEGVKAKLRPYQQKGFEWFNLMAEINAGTLLADDMGLGKTLQAITSMAHWLKENPKSKFLIIAPASLIYNWKSEFEKFAPGLKLFIFHGADRDIHNFIKNDNQVLITSYALVRNDNSIFCTIHWEAIVLDESHNIKNYTSQQTQAVLKLNGKRRIILNGTPVMNKIDDLFPQLHFLLPQLFPSRKHFKDQFVKPLQKKSGSGQMDALKKLTSPFILRRTKETAAPDLPQKTESIFWCDMENEQRTAYEEIKAQVKKNIMVDISDKGLNKTKLGVLQGITKLRQVCSSPRLLKNEPDFSATPSIKIDSLIQLLTSDLADEKTVVFSQFLGTMDLLSDAFEKNGIDYRRFSGKTAAKERTRLVSEFQDDNSNIQVFLLSLMAGNSGINLTNASYVFLVEPWWNKAVQQQAIDRLHRIGQKQNVFAYNMICKNTIEEKILDLQRKKQILSDEVIADDSNFLKNMTEDDINFLFE
jgi:SNF2 family DNA or RNA helicase